jgi:hypothetical protein
MAREDEYLHQSFFLLLVSNTIPRMMGPPLAIWRLQHPLHKLLLLLLHCWWQLLLIITVLLVFRFFVLYTVYAWISMIEQLRFSVFLLGVVVLDIIYLYLTFMNETFTTLCDKHLYLWFLNYHLWEWKKMVIFFHRSVPFFVTVILR